MNESGRVAIEGLELEYELRGSGEPVVLIHWGVSAAWAGPLVHEAALADRHLLLSYDRAGFGRSASIDGPVTMADHAEHCRLLMQELGISGAHVVGHSSSAVVALQLALDFPDAVRSLVLMEPARPAPRTEVQAAFLRDIVEPAVELYRSGDKAAAVDIWARGVFGPEYRGPLERALPDALERCVADADAFFTQELPALQQWSFTEADAGRIAQPVLLVLGEHTVPTFPERVELLGSWLPNVETFELPGATHLLHLEDARGMADAIAAFFARHPIAAPSSARASRVALNS